MAPHSSTLAWKIHGRRNLEGCMQSMGSWRVGHDWATSLSLFTFMHWRRKWQPTPVFLPGEPQERGSLGGLPSMGSHRVGHDLSDLAAAAAVFSIPQNYLKLTYNLSKKNVLPVKTFLVINPLPSLPTRLLLLSPWSSEILEPATESYLLSLRYFGVLLLWLAPLSS